LEEVLAYALLALVTGSLVYCFLTVVAARRYRAVRPPSLGTPVPISVLKPLAGLDDGLEENLRSFFEQDYPYFEILFAVRSPQDPALAVVQKLRAAYPTVPAQTIVTGEPPYPNAKVYSLDHMLAASRYDLLVMADSDVRATPAMLSILAAEFQDAGLGMATCPYRASPGNSFWSTLEAVGLNTEFLGGVLVARMLDGVKFALGPAIAARRSTLAHIGGLDALQNYLAEDFVMGKRAAERGEGVILSSYIIEHRIGAQPLFANLKHRLRWNRSTRRSRPWGYLGQVFTNPLPLALALWIAAPVWWPVAVLAMIGRAVAAWATAQQVLADPLTRRLWFLVPFADFVGFVMWIAGFFGNTVLWRGHRYYLLSDGRFRLVK
jgi:ceramide glucosyltransferase